MSGKKIVFTGGGTAGHVFPAFPVVKRLKKTGFEIFWIGSSAGMEKPLVEAEGIKYYGIPSGKLRRYFSIKNFTDLFKIAAGFIRSVIILKKEKPDLLFSKGGFVSVPPVAAARLLNIRSVTHESDADPGLATRLNIKLGARIFVSYTKTLEYLPESAVSEALVTGNPVRDELLNGEKDKGRMLAGLTENDNRPLLLVLGGSQGAEEINKLIDASINSLLDFCAVVHQSGNNYSPVRKTGGGYLVKPFFSGELPHLFAAADLAVSRSGASSLWELAAAAVPALLIPLRTASRGDQVLNAEIAEKNGMAVVLQKNIAPEDFAELVKNLILDKQRLSEMKKSSYSFSEGNAADKIAQAISEMLR